MKETTKKLALKMDDDRTVYVWLSMSAYCIDVLTSSDLTTEDFRYEAEILPSGHLHPINSGNFKLVV